MPNETHGIDIKVTEAGAQQAADAILKIGDAAKKSGGDVGGLQGALDALTGALAAIGLSLSLKSLYEAGLEFRSLKDGIEGAKKALLDFNIASAASINLISGMRKSAVGVTLETLEPKNTASAGPGGGANPEFAAELADNAKEFRNALASIKTDTAEVTSVWNTFQIAMDKAIKSGTVGTKELVADVVKLGVAVEGVTPQNARLNEAFDQLEDHIKTSVAAGATGLGALGRAVSEVGATTTRTAAIEQKASADRKAANAAAVASQDQLILSNRTMLETAVQLAAAHNNIGRSLAVRELAQVGLTAAERAAYKASLESVDVFKKIYDISQTTATSFKDNVNAFTAMATSAKGLGINLDTLTNAMVRVTDAGQGADFAKWLGSFNNGVISGRQLLELMKKFPDIAASVASGFEKANRGAAQLFLGAEKPAKNAAEALARLSIETINTEQAQEVLRTKIDPVRTKLDALRSTVEQTKIRFAEAALTTKQFWQYYAAGMKPLEEADLTVEHSLQRLSNAFTLFVGSAGGAINENKVLAGAIAYLADNMETLVRVAIVLSTVLGLVGAARFIASFVNMRTVVLAMVTALIVFGDQITIATDSMGGTVTVAQILRATMIVLTEAVTNLAIYWNELAKTMTPEMSNTMKAALLALAASITAIVLPAVAALAAAIAALTLEYLIIRGAIAAARGQFSEFKQEVMDVYDVIKQKFSLAMDEAGKKTDDLTKKVNTDKDAQEQLKKSVGSMGDAVADVEKKVRDSAASHDKMGQASHKLATQIKTDAQENTRWFDTWTTQAEHDLDMLSKKEDDELRKRRQAALPAGGSGTPLGSFTTFSPAAASRSDALSRVEEQQAKLDLLRAKDEVAGITSDAIADALEKSIGLARAKINLIDKQWRVDAHGLDQPYGGIGGPADFSTYGGGAGGLSKFGNGGLGTVLGSGGADNQLVQFVATPGEKVGVFTNDQWTKWLGGIENPWWMGNTPGGQFPSLQSPSGISPFGPAPGAPPPSGGGAPWGNGTRPPIYLTMPVSTPDAGSFRRNQQQIMLQLASKLNSVQKKLPI